jgi:hypothetical protein
MRCDEVQFLQEPYLDSELDARATLEIQQHLKECVDCAHLFAEAQMVDECLVASLNRGERTFGLWERVERAVSAAGQKRSGQIPSPGEHRRLIAVLNNELHASWARAPWVWAGLTAAWMSILLLNATARQTDAMPTARQPAPSTSEIRFALRQKQVLMVELAIPSENSSVGQSKVAAPGPRSQRHMLNLNT